MRKYLDEIIIYYLNDVTIYLGTLKKSKYYRRKIHDVLSGTKISVNETKSEFYI